MIARTLRFLVLSFLAAATIAHAQETRGTISGTVIDEQATAVPGATVTVRNLDTNVSNTLIANSSGYYEASLLLPGNYRVTAELVGFKTAVRNGIILSVGQQVDVKISLAVGAISETVTVTGEAPILDTSVVTTGQNLDRRSVESLPMFANMPVLLTRFVAGVNSSADVPYVAQGFVNRTSSDTSSPGGVGGNEWTIDGATNNGSDRRLASSPNSDMIQEVRIDTANFDASFGHSTGLGISMMTRSGTNQMHGSMNYQYWNNQWNAPKYFAKKNYYDNIAQARARGDEVTVRRLSSQKINPLGKSNNLANTFGGPVMKDKLFIFANYSWNHDDRPAVSQHSIPTAENLRGDFSNLLAVDPVQYQIYDPLTTRPDPARPGFFIRDPFPGNIIPQSRIINPLYAAYSKWLPTPNNNPTDPTRVPTNNYQANTYTDPIDSQIYGVRVDYNLSNTHRFFGRWSGSDFKEGLNDWTYQSAPGLHNEDMRRTTNAGTVNWTWVKNATTVIDAQGSANAFFEGGDRNTLATFKPSDVGLPTYLDQRCEASNEARLASSRGGSCALPIINFGTGAYQPFGKNAAEGYDTLNLQFTMNLTKIRGQHTWHAGTDARRHARSGFNPGASQGSFTFDNTYTRRYSDTALYTAGNLGLSWAAFMLGLPTVSTITTPTDYATSSPYYSAFAQDAWRITQKLTMNVGLRFEFEQGMREKADRMLVGFDPNATPAIRDEAVAAYARNSVPELSVSAFRNNLTGSGVYAGVNGQTRRAWKSQAMWLPRASAAYQVSDRMVVRGGYGVYYDTLNATAIVPNQLGYNTVTSVNSSNDFGQTWVSGNPKAGISPLVDPFPLRADGTRFVSPVGNTLGGDFVAGNTLTYGNLDREHARMQRWRLGAQRELGRNMAIEVAYVGSFADNVDVNVRQDVLPEQYWNSTATRNTALASNLNANVPNPFFIGNFEGLRASNPALYSRLAAQSLFASPTVAKNRLLRPSPFMAALTAGQRPIGKVRTHSVEVTFQRRFSRGLSLNVGYVGLRAEEWTTIINEYEQRPTQWVSSNNARPHRVTAGTVWELPFGKGRAFLNNGGMLGKILGGWQTGHTFEWQPGPLLDFSGQNIFFYGNLEDIPLSEPSLDRWFNVDAGFERNSARVPAEFQTRLFPLRVEGVRRDQTLLLNSTISRTFPVKGHTMFQIRLDAQNSLNRQHFANPTSLNPTSTDFGRVTANANTEQRFLVLIGKLTF